MIRTAVLRLRGQNWGSPSGVLIQSCARSRVPISPPPERKSVAEMIAGVLNSWTLFKSGSAEVARDFELREHSQETRSPPQHAIARPPADKPVVVVEEFIQADFASFLMRARERSPASASCPNPVLPPFAQTMMLSAINLRRAWLSPSGLPRQTRSSAICMQARVRESKPSAIILAPAR